MNWPHRAFSVMTAAMVHPIVHPKAGPMLTDTQIKRVMKSAPKDVTLTDGSGGRGTGSLRLRVRTGRSGEVTATWLAWWKQGGKRASKVLGVYPDMTLAQARVKYGDEVRPVLQAGRSPRVAVVATEKPTVQRLFEGYVADMRARNCDSADEVARMLLDGDDSAAAVLGRGRLAADVIDKDVVGYVVRFFAAGHRGAADKARSYVSAAFGWAKKSANDYTVATRLDWGIRANPCADVPRDPAAKRARDRALTASEIARLWRGLDGAGFGLEVASCVRLLILLGQRVRETLRMDGREIDLAAALWTIPAHKTKGRIRRHLVPLPPQAVEVLRVLKAAHGDGALFPARTRSKVVRIHDRSINHALRRWQVATGATRFQSRDLRRTWKTRAADAGVDRFTRDLIQQHAHGDTSGKHYDFADYLPQMREAMRKWGDWLDMVLADQQRHPQPVAA